MISVIVPVYNLQDYIERCVLSIQNQIYSDFELIIIDDGSIDNTGKICDQLAENDERIRIYHKSNGGAASARKFGIDHSKGEYLIFVDGDDTIPPTALQNLLNLIIENDVDIAIGTLNLNNQSIFNHKIKSGKINNIEYIKSILEGNTSVGLCAKIFKTYIVKNICTNISDRITNNEDLCFLIKIAALSKKIFINNNMVCYNYLTRHDSASQSIKMDFDNWILLFKELDTIIKPLEKSDYSIANSLLQFKQNRIYNNIILCGKRFSSSDSYIKQLYQELEISQKHYLIRYLLSSYVLRLLIFKYFSLLRNLKKSIKSIIK